MATDREQMLVKVFKRGSSHQVRAARKLAAACTDTRLLASLLRHAASDDAFELIYKRILALGPGVEEIAIAVRFAEKQKLSGLQLWALNCLVKLGKQYDDFLKELMLATDYPSRYYDRECFNCRIRKPDEYRHALQTYFGGNVAAFF
jgi:hypothetical protein